MAKVNFYRVASLPAELVPGSLYFVENGTFTESYVVGTNGVARSIGNSAMIRSIIAEELQEWGEASNMIEIVADIDARDLLAMDKDRNMIVLVLDASDDPTVDEGSALYAYDAATQTFHKMAEYESMDVVVQWANIEGRPASSVADIDEAVTMRHTHANKATLDKLGEDSDGLLFNGQAVTSRWSETKW